MNIKISKGIMKMERTVWNGKSIICSWVICVESVFPDRIDRKMKAEKVS